MRGCGRAKVSSPAPAASACGRSHRLLVTRPAVLESRLDTLLPLLVEPVVDHPATSAVLTHHCSEHTGHTYEKSFDAMLPSPSSHVAS